MKKILFPLLLLCFATTGRSQDSLVHVIQGIITEDSLIHEEMRFNRDGLFMPLRGLIQTFTHRDFNELPGPYRPNNHRWEDYGVALTPLAATWMMKICGVKSRSNTRRMITANGLSLGLTVGLAQTLRWTVTEKRPDGQGTNSLPSVHASLAYMGATILSREYGHISPWITIGGYTAATGTQMLRIGHNAHWVNDIFLGAGIGVVSTNLAYFLTDKIIGPKGVRAMPFSASEQAQLLAWNNCPSGFRLVSGTETNGRSLDVEDFAEAAAGFDLAGIRLRSSASITSGFEAEWFINNNLYLSAIGRYTLSGQAGDSQQQRDRLGRAGPPLPWQHRRRLDATAHRAPRPEGSHARRHTDALGRTLQRRHHVPQRRERPDAGPGPALHQATAVPRGRRRHRHRHAPEP